MTRASEKQTLEISAAETKETDQLGWEETEDGWKYKIDKTVHVFPCIFRYIVGIRLNIFQVSFYIMAGKDLAISFPLTSCHDPLVIKMIQKSFFFQPLIHGIGLFIDLILPAVLCFLPARSSLKSGGKS